MRSFQLCVVVLCAGLSSAPALAQSAKSAAPTDFCVTNACSTPGAAPPAAAEPAREPTAIERVLARPNATSDEIAAILREEVDKSGNAGLKDFLEGLEPGGRFGVGTDPVTREPSVIFRMNADGQTASAISQRRRATP
jgi:hypothetical protein